jgi:hypothetical protein
MEGIQKILKKAKSNPKHVQKEVVKLRKTLNKEIETICGKDSFQSSSTSGKLTYLEKIIRIHENSEAFRNEEKYQEALLMRDIRKVMEHFFLLRGVDSTLIEINKCDFYSMHLPLSNVLVSAYLLLIYLHLTILKSYYNEKISSSRRWKVTSESIIEQAKRIKRFYENRIVNVSLDIEISKKVQPTQYKIQSLINMFHVMD